MRGEGGQQHEPPQTGWCQQKRCNQDRIRRPKNGYGMRLKGECKTYFAPKIVSSEHPQPDHQQMPVKNGTETVCVLLYWLNARGFKRDGSALHLQRISPLQKANFWENALSNKSERHAGAEISPDSAVTVPV